MDRKSSKGASQSTRASGQAAAQQTPWNKRVGLPAAAIVVGTSGIGKSAFRFYVMRQWLKGHEKLPKARFPKVILNLGDIFYEMDDSCAVHELPEVRSLAKLPADRLALLDPCVQIAGLDKSLHFNFMLVTTSASPLSGQETKVDNYKELIKALLDAFWSCTCGATRKSRLWRPTPVMSSLGALI